MGSLGGSDWVDPDDHPTSEPGSSKRKLTKAQREEFKQINKNLRDLYPHAYDGDADEDRQ